MKVTINQMTNMENPWLNLDIASTRRIDFKIKYDFFWIIDERGRFGLSISLKQLIQLPVNAPKLKGIEIIAKNSTLGTSEIFLILNNNGEWQIFLSLCKDLFENSSSSKNEDSFLSFVIGRLLKWQKFLSQNNKCSMTEQEQMGLITELLCLKDFILPNCSAHESIISWVGPEFDKQDFSLNDFFVEVKSFISSKGNTVRISSLQQLDNKIKSLYLLTFGITRTEEQVISIPLLVETLKSQIEQDPINLDLFENKLVQYGYMEGVTEPPFYSYRVDIIKCYLVSDDFPKILSSQVKPEITAAEYSIDLSRCLQFQSEFLPLLNKK